MLENIAQKNWLQFNLTTSESITMSLEFILLVRLIIRATDLSFLLFLLPDQGVTAVVVKSPWRCPINGKHTAATGWYRHQ